MCKNEIVVKLDNAVMLGLSASQLNNFEKAFVLADATKELITLLDQNQMQRFMILQNKAIGFKTDKDQGYPLDVVRLCLISALLTGVQAVGNHFNIIAGNCYVTKEGFGYLLQKLEGIKYEIVPNIPEVKGNQAIIKMSIKWEYKGTKETREMPFCIKTNSYMGADAIIGKATRKARAWLYNTVTDNEINDAEVEELRETEVVKDKDVSILEDKEEIAEAKTELNFQDILMGTPYDPERILKYLIYIKEVDNSTTLDILLNSELCEGVRNKIVNDQTFFKSIINKMLSLEEQQKAKEKK